MILYHERGLKFTHASTWLPYLHLSVQHIVQSQRTEQTESDERRRQDGCGAVLH